MIRFVRGDIFEPEVDAIVNPVNTVGVMGAGLARSFKYRFPENYSDYAVRCKRHQLNPGDLFIKHDQGMYGYIINFATKRHWKDPSQIHWIEEGLTHLADVIVQLEIKSIAIPALGAGLGGLNFRAVAASIEQALGHLHDVEILVFNPR